MYTFYLRQPLPPAQKLLLRQQHLLLILDSLCELDIDLESTCDDICGGQGQPLAQRDILHFIGLVDLDPDQVFGFGRVLDVVAAVVREHSGVAGLEVEGARFAVADEYGRAAVALMEVEPFFGLSGRGMLVWLDWSG